MMMDVLDRCGWERCRDRGRSKTSQTTQSAKTAKSRSAISVGRKKRWGSIARRRRSSVAFNFANLAFSVLLEMAASAQTKWNCSNRSPCWNNGHRLDIGNNVRIDTDSATIKTTEAIKTAGSVGFTTNFGALEKENVRDYNRMNIDEKVKELHTSLARPSLQSFSLM